jgi:hypothetical protein
MRGNLDKPINIAQILETLSNKYPGDWIMAKHYFFAFLMGWVFNYAIDVTAVTRSTMSWLQHSWLAPFYDTGAKQGKRS